MKKILSLLVVLGFVFVLSACDKTSSDRSDGNASGDTTQEEASQTDEAAESLEEAAQDLGSLFEQSINEAIQEGVGELEQATEQLNEGLQQASEEAGQAVEQAEQAMQETSEQIDQAAQQAEEAMQEAGNN